MAGNAKNLHPVDQLKRDLWIRVGIQILGIEPDQMAEWLNGLSRSAIYKINSSTTTPNMSVADVIESTNS